MSIIPILFSINASQNIWMHLFNIHNEGSASGKGITTDNFSLLSQKQSEKNLYIEKYKEACSTFIITCLVRIKKNENNINVNQ